MAGEIKNKLNHLLRVWPTGTVAVVPWLTKQGVYQQLAYEYERSGWIDRVGRGAYIRSGDKVEWPGAVYAMQNQLGLSIHVGAKSALELRGFGHFISANLEGYLYLFGSVNEKPASWFLEHNWKKKISYKMSQLFKKDFDLGLTKHSFGNFEIKISAPERAMFETLHLIPKEQTLEEALLLMVGLTTLRPKLVQELLEKCKSIKIKRLFLALAERCNHSWFNKLNLSKVELGKGKRMLVKGGVLDPKYRITMPRVDVEGE